MQTTTTHPAQINMLRNAFKIYGENRVYLSKNKSRGDEWFIYVDLHPSFKFLLEKLNKIPEWILTNDKYFYEFLSAYADCEGNWHVAKSHDKHSRFVFRIRSQDYTILKQLKNKLKTKGFTPLLAVERKRGCRSTYGIYNKDMFGLIFNKKNDLVKLIKVLLPLSKHEEKIIKMKFILNNLHNEWKEIEEEWLLIRKNIKQTLLKNQIMPKLEI